MQFTLLGTGDVARLPVRGCACPACARAHQQPIYRREACSAQIKCGDALLLIDAGLPDLEVRFPVGRLSAILLTHYHMDHVHSLFRLRWGLDEAIPVYGPADAVGCDDLFRNPGNLVFQPPWRAFECRDIAGIRVTALPLTHSKRCMGYAVSDGQRRIAYLTDTKGLSAEVSAFLTAWQPEAVVLDCTFPSSRDGGSHNTVNEALALAATWPQAVVWLTHVGHEAEVELMKNPRALPPGVRVSYDGAVI